MDNIMDKGLLIRKLKLGDVAIFKSVFDIYHNQLYAVALNYLKDKELSEDAVQEVFVKLWTYRAKLDPEQSLEGFLFTLIKNQVLSMIRANKRRINKKIAYSFLHTKKPVNPVEDAVVYSEYEAIFTRALDELPSGKREVFRLRSQNGFTNQQVADLLNITVNTVKSQYYEASRFIKKYLDEHAGISMKKRKIR